MLIAAERDNTSVLLFGNGMQIAAKCEVGLL